ncbi:hypothetical protein GCM10010274_12240 [Streptomyces lavendofoliae]|uniref:Uncharacterized protein n=1 Tax=Streptomyces lavendofoliae TaxID=67314 RepID=A0A918M2A5_9ACTN|nr:hypothetical protein GCM10010274_12240 [Streptomyces lavendofoliae]
MWALRVTLPDMQEFIPEESAPEFRLPAPLAREWATGRCVRPPLPGGVRASLSTEARRFGKLSTGCANPLWTQKSIIPIAVSSPWIHPGFPGQTRPTHSFGWEILALRS